MDRYGDSAIWSFAAANDFTIVSKDWDFRQLAFVKGAPPKIIWIQLGNCSTREIVKLLRSHRNSIEEFVTDDAASFLALRGR